MIDKLDAKDPQNRSVTDYARAFQARWKTDVSSFGGYAYDGLMLTVDAIKRAGSADKAKVRDALEATKGYVGASGRGEYERQRPYGPGFVGLPPGGNQIRRLGVVGQQVKGPPS